MTCDQCRGIEGIFGQRQAERQLNGYRKRGPAKTTRMLISALEAQGVSGLTLLDIGGGIGAIQLGLLKAGVTTATDVDASTGYIATARTAAEGEGLADRIAYRHGDFTALAPEVAPAGIVTLDRVICCYHDMRGLVSQSAAKAAKLYGVVYPRDTWWTRAFVAAGNFFLRLRRDPFRAFVHPTAAVDALIRSGGLAPRFLRNAGPWQVVVYVRSA
ncbi:MAG TPA: methyltransferase domain-containing protein [Ktedonobacterales bacterium]|nr:methyltransferase domain-containing protein [Ktedonobacterales bacterium]